MPSLAVLTPQFRSVSVLSPCAFAEYVSAKVVCALLRSAVAVPAATLTSWSERLHVVHLASRKLQLLINMSAIGVRSINNGEPLQSEQEEHTLTSGYDSTEGLEDNSSCDKLTDNSHSEHYKFKEFLSEGQLETIRQLHSSLDPQRDVLERSACQTAAGRALWNHVIHDPLAEVFAGETFLSSLQEKMNRDRERNARETAGVMLAVRTLWFDARLEEALGCFASNGAGPQVVLLGAGMDARAYRLSSLKDCSVFEVDFPKVVQLKDSILQAMKEYGQTLPTMKAKSIQKVEADIASQDWFFRLVHAGYNPNLPTVWMLEGLLYYLHESDAMETLKCISGNCKNETVLLADFMNESSIQLARELNTNFYFHSDWPEELLPSLGFSQVKVSQIGDVDANFGLVRDELNLFNQMRSVPRHVKADSHGKPYRRLLLVKSRVA